MNDNERKLEIRISELEEQVIILSSNNKLLGKVNIDLARSAAHEKKCRESIARDKKYGEQIKNDIIRAQELELTAMLERAKRAEAEVELLREALFSALPRCNDCTRVAWYMCQDATGEPIRTCHEHSFTGGMMEDSEPTELYLAARIQKDFPGLIEKYSNE